MIPPIEQHIYLFIDFTFYFYHIWVFICVSKQINLQTSSHHTQNQLFINQQKNNNCKFFINFYKLLCKMQFFFNIGATGLLLVFLINQLHIGESQNDNKNKENQSNKLKFAKALQVFIENLNKYYLNRRNASNLFVEILGENTLQETEKFYFKDLDRNITYLDDYYNFIFLCLQDKQFKDSRIICEDQLFHIVTIYREIFLSFLYKDTMDILTKANEILLSRVREFYKL